MGSIFKLLSSTNHQVYFNLVAPNGEVILTSEMYTAKASADNGIESVRVNAPISTRYEQRISTAGEPYFVLTAGNGEIIGVSEMYSSEAARDNGIESVMVNAATAEVEDHTAPSGKGIYDLSRSSDGQFYFNLKAVNGRVIVTSELYTSKGGAEGGIDSVRTNAADDDRYERRVSDAAEPFFVLKAGNHQVIGVSEMYSSIAARDNGIESVKEHGPDAKVEDRT